MKNEILFNLTYGMYAIGVKDENKASACIVNTVIQVCNTPNMLAGTIAVSAVFQWVMPSAPFITKLWS